jgi:hypothetical protein
LAAHIFVDILIPVGNYERANFKNGKGTSIKVNDIIAF